MKRAWPLSYFFSASAGTSHSNDEDEATKVNDNNDDDDADIDEGGVDTGNGLPLSKRGKKVSKPPKKSDLTAREITAAIAKLKASPVAICSFYSQEYWVSMLEFLHSHGRTSFPSDECFALVKMLYTINTEMADTREACAHLDIPMFKNAAIVTSATTSSSSVSTERKDIEAFIHLCLQYVVENHNVLRRRRITAGASLPLSYSAPSSCSSAAAASSSSASSLTSSFMNGGSSLSGSNGAAALASDLDTQTDSTKAPIKAHHTESASLNAARGSNGLNGLNGGGSHGAVHF